MASCPVAWYDGDPTRFTRISSANTTTTMSILRHWVGCCRFAINKTIHLWRFLDGGIPHQYGGAQHLKVKVARAKCLHPMECQLFWGDHSQSTWSQLPDSKPVPAIHQFYKFSPKAFPSPSPHTCPWDPKFMLIHSILCTSPEANLRNAVAPHPCQLVHTVE